MKCPTGQHFSKDTTTPYHDVSKEKLSNNFQSTPDIVSSVFMT